MSRELTVPEPYELTLDAPGKNALSTALMRHIVDEVRSAAGRPILITGAGDTFCGSFLARILFGDDPERAARYASVAAALKCTGYGAVAPIPRAAEVLAAMQGES